MRPYTFRSNEVFARAQAQDIYIYILGEQVEVVEVRSLKPYPKGFFKTVIQKEYARASQKQIRKDLSDMAMPCYVACIVATCTGDHDNYGIWLGCVLLFASDTCCVNDMGTVLIISSGF